MWIIEFQINDPKNYIICNRNALILYYQYVKYQAMCEVVPNCWMVSDDKYPLCCFWLLSFQIFKTVTLQCIRYKYGHFNPST